MFINLISDSIPFEEYYASPEQIYAYKQRLLSIADFLEICMDPPICIGDNYNSDGWWVYLVSKEYDRVTFIIINDRPTWGWNVFPHMVVLSDEGDRFLSEQEVIDFILKVYELHPDKSLTKVPLPSKEFVDTIYFGLEQHILNVVCQSKRTYRSIYRDFHTDFLQFGDWCNGDSKSEKEAEEENKISGKIQTAMLKVIYNIDDDSITDRI